VNTVRKKLTVAGLAFAFMSPLAAEEPKPNNWLVGQLWSRNESSERPTEVDESWSIAVNEWERLRQESATTKAPRVLRIEGGVVEIVYSSGQTRIRVEGAKIEIPLHDAHLSITVE